MIIGMDAPTEAFRSVQGVAWGQERRAPSKRFFRLRPLVNSLDISFSAYAKKSLCRGNGKGSGDKRLCIFLHFLQTWSLGLNEFKSIYFRTTVYPLSCSSLMMPCSPK